MRTWPGQRGPHFSLPWTGLGVGPETPFPSTPQLPSLILNTRWERGGDSGRWKERDSKKRNRQEHVRTGTGEDRDTGQPERLEHPGDRLNQGGTSRDEESQTHSLHGSAQLCFLGKLLLLSEPQFPYLSDKGDQWPYAQWPVRGQWSLSHADKPEALSVALLVIFSSFFLHIY